MNAATPTRIITVTAALLAAGAVGGAVAQLAHLPLPWMLGSLAAAALVVIFAPYGPMDGYSFPLPFRSAFVALIGVMIGTQVTPEVVAQLGALPLTLAALVVFILVAQVGNYVIFRRVGGLDPATAFYSSTPGGLMESLLMGEAAGADTRQLTLQQFLRIICVIVIVPTALSLWLGRPVGSAAGAVSGVAHTGPVSLVNLALIGLTAAGGLALARVIHLPAAQLIGPFILSSALTLSGLVDLHLPFWLIALAQVVIGVSLGLRFRGTTLTILRRALALALLTVLFMLALGALLSWALSAVTGLPFLYLLISFAPGGVTEMSVIALSLAANPAFVSVHHVARILLTVLLMAAAAKWLPIARPRDGK